MAAISRALIWISCCWESRQPRSRNDFPQIGERSLDDCNFQLDDLTDPSCRPLIAWGHDAEWPFSSIERFSIPLVGKDNFADGECRINLRKGKTHFVTVGCGHLQNLGHSWSA